MPATPYESSNGHIGRFQDSSHPLKGGCGLEIAVYAQLPAIKAMTRGVAASLESGYEPKNGLIAGGRAIENKLYAQSNTTALSILLPIDWTPTNFL